MFNCFIEEKTINIFYESQYLSTEKHNLLTKKKRWFKLIGHIYNANN